MLQTDGRAGCRREKRVPIDPQGLGGSRDPSAPYNNPAGNYSGFTPASFTALAKAFCSESIRVRTASGVEGAVSWPTLP
jgi:hypothetical protein